MYNWYRWQMEFSLLESCINFGIQCILSRHRMVFVVVVKADCSVWLVCLVQNPEPGVRSQPDRGPHGPVCGAWRARHYVHHLEGQRLDKIKLAVDPRAAVLTFSCVSPAGLLLPDPTWEDHVGAAPPPTSTTHSHQLIRLLLVLLTLSNVWPHESNLLRIATRTYTTDFLFSSSREPDLEQRKTWRIS